jgi:hypothetical protein
MKEVIALMIPIIACGTTVLLAALCFPSTRRSLAAWLHGRASGDMDGPVATQLASANAQLAALRGEVYALRCEVAVLAQALPPALRAPALPELRAGVETK